MAFKLVNGQFKFFFEIPIGMVLCSLKTVSLLETPAEAIRALKARFGKERDRQGQQNTNGKTAMKALHFLALKLIRL